MSDDIVTRLRLTNGLDARLLHAAADEIERLRRDYSAAERDHVEYVAKYHNATVEIDRITDERDEARREVLQKMHPDLRNGYAAAREWDCFKEETDGH